MTSEVEQKQTLVTAGYGRHRSQWANLKCQSRHLEPSARREPRERGFLSLASRDKTEGGRYVTFQAKVMLDQNTKIILDRISTRFTYNSLSQSKKCKISRRQRLPLGSVICLEWLVPKPITRSLQLPHIAVTAFSRRFHG